MQRKSSYRKPVIFAMGLHVLLFVLLFWRLSSSQLQQLQVQPDVDIIKAVAVSPPKIHPPIEKPIKPIEEPQKPPVVAHQLEPEKMERAQTELLRQKPVKQKPAQEKLQSEQKKPEVTRPELKIKEAVEKPQKTEVKKPAPVKQAISTPQKQPAPPKPEIVKPKKQPIVTEDDLAQAINEEKAEQEKVAEQRQKLKLKQKQEKELQAQIAAEKKELEAAKTSQQQSEIEKYKALIEQAISQNWVVPGGSNPDLSCTLLIKVGPGGAVLQVQIARSSGDAGLDNSARSAVFKASPLPVPDDAELFNQFREMRLAVKPEQVIGGE